jgi:hypothetical protein
MITKNRIRRTLSRHAHKATSQTTVTTKWREEEAEEEEEEDT